jgi:hypothetical protein
MVPGCSPMDAGPVSTVATRSRWSTSLTGWNGSGPRVRGPVMASTITVDAEGTFDRPYEPFHRGGLSQMRVLADDGRVGTAIYEVTGARHHHFFPDTEIDSILPS